MNNLIFGISLSAILSVTSLIIVMLRVSPLLAPKQALPAFFGSVFLSVSTIGMLIAIFAWKKLPYHTWDNAKLVSVSLRQGIFLGTGTVILLLFHLLEMLNWWIALLIYAVFVLIELALEQ